MIKDKIIAKKIIDDNKIIADDKIRQIGNKKTKMKGGQQKCQIK